MTDLTPPLATPAWRELAAMQDHRPSRVTWVVAAIVAAVVAVAVGQRAAAAETQKAAWMLVICERGKECVTRDKPLSSRVACQLDMAAETIVEPVATKLVCIREMKR
jgi:hypothetical protein